MVDDCDFFDTNTENFSDLGALTDAFGLNSGEETKWRVPALDKRPTKPISIIKHNKKMKDGEKFQKQEISADELFEGNEQEIKEIK